MTKANVAHWVIFSNWIHWEKKPTMGNIGLKICDFALQSLQDSVVEDREQQQGSNMLGVLSAEGYQVFWSKLNDWLVDLWLINWSIDWSTLLISINQCCHQTVASNMMGELGLDRMDTGEEVISKVCVYKWNFWKQLAKEVQASYYVFLPMNYCNPKLRRLQRQNTRKTKRHLQNLALSAPTPGFASNLKTANTLPTIVENNIEILQTSSALIWKYSDLSPIIQLVSNLKVTDSENSSPCEVSSFPIWNCLFTLASSLKTWFIFT